MNKVTNNLSQESENIEKLITVMVTDLKNASLVTKVESDAVKHREHHDIVSLAIRLNNGVFVKGIDDDMLFRFNNAQDAISAAVEIQKDIDRLNMTNKFKNPVLMRISLHSGKYMAKDSKIPDDIINFAQHMKSFMLPGETFASKDTCNALNNRRGIHFRPTNQSIPNKKEPVSIYKVLWNPQEVELANSQGANSTSTEQPVVASKLKLILIVIIPLLLVLLLTLYEDISSQLSSEYEPRAIHQSIEK
jgi:class 3 adenylate cyclase